MSSIGLSVPPGLIITTETCEEYNLNGSKLPDGLWDEIIDALRTVEEDMGAALGDPANLLLVSVRSGAAPKMKWTLFVLCDTLELNDEVVRGLAAHSGERFAYDSDRRFIDMFGRVVMGMSHSLYKHELESMKDVRRVHQDTDLTTEDPKEIVQKYKDVYKKAIGWRFGHALKEQALFLRSLTGELSLWFVFCRIIGVLFVSLNPISLIVTSLSSIPWNLSPAVVCSLYQSGVVIPPPFPYTVSTRKTVSFCPVL